ncbi:MAG: Eco57I restriction-modification methylase domain-containing protein [Bacilli bacterium]|jgi:predicted RNA methylase|nr:Eco57I restriction-modification methylase domain-containing protein [Bacilli bacterium]
MGRINLGQVFTPKIISDFMVGLFDMGKKANILDPCFGEGVFVNSLKDKGFSNVTAIELDKKLFDSFDAPFGFKKINCDFLNYSGLLFDGIIMNPPYVRQEEINGLKQYGITKEMLRSKKIYSSLPRKANLYSYFVIKSLSLLKSDGELVLIIPSTWTKNDSYLNKAICRAGGFITYQANCVGLPFGKNVLVDVDILKIKKGLYSDSKVVINKNLAIANDVLEISNVQENKLLGNKNCISLNVIAKVKRGISSGNNDMYFKDCSEILSKYKKPILSNPRSISSFLVNKKCLSYCLTIPNNMSVEKELDDYIQIEKQKIIDTKSPLGIFNKIQNNDLTWYCFNPTKCPKNTIVFGYIVRANLKFSITAQECIIRDNFYTINSNDQLLLLSLLNNYYCYYRVEMAGKKYGGGLLKLQCYDIKNIQIINPELLSLKDKNELIKNAELLIKSLSSQSQQIIKENTLLLSKYEDISNVDIEKIYFSTKERRLISK